MNKIPNKPQNTIFGLLIFLLLFFVELPFFQITAAAADTVAFSNPFYVGALGGYGSTTWQWLVPSLEKQNLAMNLSTPINAIEGGGVWGFFSGYEFTPYFAIEATYLNYPNSTIIFDSSSLFTFLHNGQTKFTSKTQTANVMAKFFIFIPNTTIRAFSSLGAATVHRSDLLYNHWHLTPTFGVGLNHLFTPHIMGELSGNYTAGYGEAQLNPTEVYLPFLYAITVRLAYRF